MIYPEVRVAPVDDVRGLGLFAAEEIAPGQLVWELTDPVYRLEEVQQWDDKKLELFKHYGFQCGEDSFSLPFGDSREMNHCCDPSLHWAGSGKLVSRRRIKIGEEVNYDYATSEIVFPIDMPCSCGAQTCRGKITHLDYLDETWQQQYGENLPAHVINAIKAATDSEIQIFHSHSQLLLRTKISTATRTHSQ